VSITALELKIEGLVQGVGFRPFVYRIAKREHISGWVRNTSSGVLIHIQAESQYLNNFIYALKTEAPPASAISNLIIEEKSTEYLSEFSILSSHDSEEDFTQISPDIAVCGACLTDISIQKTRINYPFTNCTNCGPRFSIIQDIPYDRKNTTMDEFPMCENCKKEYEDIENRRFHAQPIACNDCGPTYLLDSNQECISSLEQILDRVGELIRKGGIIAVKGIGGFFLMCDASNEEAVSRLRKSKVREGKPFAVLFRNIEIIKSYAFLTETEENSLNSWQRPIIILEAKKKLAPSVCMDFPTIGAILPYMPVHYMLFDRIKADALVLTSGNLSDEPIIIDNILARTILGNITDAVLYYNRDIHNRVDDSVGFILNHKLRIIRRSRGYAPSPLFLNSHTEGILATGAELNNCFCIGKGKQAILSQHIGDLKNFETFQFYIESIERFSVLFRVKPTFIAYDLHPDYLSTSYALDQGLTSFGIQHHHAHIASCMTENSLDERVIGVAMDGTGYGTDGSIWGSEFVISDLLDFERVAHLPYIPLPGGDSVTKEPWRTGLSLLYSIFGADISQLDLPFLQKLDVHKKQLILAALDKGINSPKSCSAGRWFDAVAAITGICVEAGFHAEAPMRLEACIDKSETKRYPWEILSKGDIELKKLIEAIIHDIHSKIPVSKISARFHNTIAEIIIHQINTISKNTGIKKAVVSGGTFQNKYLLAKLESEYDTNEIKLYTQTLIPANDAGIALGQLAIAARRREQGLL
jgi:hydrogenase maturation protein HypF